jgi:hypothetical protein
LCGSCDRPSVNPRERFEDDSNEEGFGEAAEEDFKEVA